MKNLTNISCGDIDYLKSLTIFKCLSDSEFKVFLEHMRYTHYKQGSVIYREKCAIKGAYIIKNGVVKQLKSGSRGRTYITRIAKAGEIMGFRSLITKEEACATAMALLDTELCYIPVNLLTKFMTSNADFAWHMMKQVSLELGQTQTDILNLAQKNVRERMAELLIHLKERFNTDEEDVIQIPLSRNDIANLVGAAKESAIRTLSDFRSEDLIELSGRKIKLLDVYKLNRIGNIAI